MKIKVNGEAKTYDLEKVSVSEMLKIGDVQSPELVTVQLNGQFVKKGEYNNTYLNENDEIEFMYFMGGGQEG